MERFREPASAAAPSDDQPVSILVVDDRAESLLAIEAALGSLNLDIVTASSGAETLRHLLRQDFALILLDVHMPRMDGLETAEQIRSRPRSAHTPIIFVTAYTDDMHISRGYSLGAVDYILAPVVPEVLRSKVSVFVDLYRKNAQISRQAELLGERAERQRRLTDASLAIHSSESLNQLLAISARTAAELVDGLSASVASVGDLRGGSVRAVVQCAPGDAPVLREGLALDSLPEPAGGIVGRNEPQVLKCTTIPSDGLLAHTAPAEVGWMGVPLRRGDGSAMGVIEVAAPPQLALDDEDLAVLFQLAHITSIAVENCLLGEEREANQLKDEFLATLSHELRTPLSAIVGWVHLLTDLGEVDSPLVAEGLKVIERSVQTQNRLIEDLLDVSRVSRGDVSLDLQPVDVAKVLQTAVESARPTATAKDVSLAFEQPDTPLLVRGDMDRAQQIFGNLLSNAIKFTPSGGGVEVRVSASEYGARVSIADTGVGISEEFLPSVFQRFRQADHGTTRRYSGLGIGLTIVKHLVEAHGGRIRLVSDGPGRGTTAVVEFPVLPSVESETLATQEHAEVECADAGADLEGVRVLVVDDQADARDVVARILRSCGAEVVTAPSVADALSVLRSAPPDLLISDLAMPGESGFSLISKVRKFPPPVCDVPAIALSALVSDDDSAGAVAAGFHLHTAKPCDPRQLIALAASLVGGNAEVRRGFASA